MEVSCPICNNPVKAADINAHIDSSCSTHIIDYAPTSSPSFVPPSATQSTNNFATSQSQTQKRSAATSFFQAPAAKRQATTSKTITNDQKNCATVNGSADGNRGNENEIRICNINRSGIKRSFEEGPGKNHLTDQAIDNISKPTGSESSKDLKGEPATKRAKIRAPAPLAERVRPGTLDDIAGQDLVGPHGILRSLIENDRVPSMILWGGSGTGKTTIARCIAQKVGSRFIELNATSTGVAEVKKYFTEAENDWLMMGRKTIIFCDEIHRFSKAQQDVFLKPVEAGTITLIGATTENPSFKVQSALLSRCRTFTLSKLTQEDVCGILARAVKTEEVAMGYSIPSLVDDDLLRYLASFSDGDARTALNLLEMTLSLANRPDITKEAIKHSLTKTLVYDRAGDQHYDTISAFHKSVRGSDADAALYYLARMLQSGEDPLFIARRMIVIASEDVGLADNTLLPLATAAYTATQQIGMPEARIPLAHCAVALALAPKSIKAYRGLNAAISVLEEPGIASLPIPLHLRNAPTRLMRDMGYGLAYKYNPNYTDGLVKQEYLPSQLRGRRFLEEHHLGTEIDPDLLTEEYQEKDVNL